jgi:hypothetical protein
MTLKAKFFGVLVALIIGSVMQNPVYAAAINQIDGNQINSSSALNFNLVSPNPSDTSSASLTLSGGLSTKFIDSTGADVTPPDAPFVTNFFSLFSLSRVGTIVFAPPPNTSPSVAYTKFDVTVDTLFPGLGDKLIHIPEFNSEGRDVTFNLFDVEALVPFTPDSARPCAPGGVVY